MEDDPASQYRVYHSFHPVQIVNVRDQMKTLREEIPTSPID
jgi:hypothetical protein